MNQIRLPLMIGLLLTGLFIFSACAPSDTTSAEELSEDGHEHMDDMMHLHVDPPDEFGNLTNPVAGEHEAIEAGMETYATLCVSCHGPEGKGDGEAGEALDPKPANLADGMMMGELSDGYLYWRVSKGGVMEPFNSVMPAWESTLSENERWQLISYIRTLSDGAGHHMEDEHHEDDDHHMEGEHHEE